MHDSAGWGGTYRVDGSPMEVRERAMRSTAPKGGRDRPGRAGKTFRRAQEDWVFASTPGESNVLVVRGVRAAAPLSRAIGETNGGDRAAIC